MSVAYTLESDRVQAARARFYRNRRKSRLPNTCKMSFEEIYKLLRDGKKLTDIAERANVSGATMTRLYDIHFRPLFGKTAEERHLENEHERKQKRLKKMQEEIPNRPHLQAVARHAVRYGHSVRTHLEADCNGRLQRRLQKINISGSACFVHWVTNARPRGDRRRKRYALVTLARKRVEETVVQLFVIDVGLISECILVIPSGRILASHFPEGAEKANFFIPFQVAAPSGRKLRSRLDPWPFKSRWDLIPVLA